MRVWLKKVSVFHRGMPSAHSCIYSGLSPQHRHYTISIPALLKVKLKSEFRALLALPGIGFIFTGISLIYNAILILGNPSLSEAPHMPEHSSS